MKNFKRTISASLATFIIGSSVSVLAAPVEEIGDAFIIGDKAIVMDYLSKDRDAALKKIEQMLSETGSSAPSIYAKADGVKDSEFFNIEDGSKVEEEDLEKVKSYYTEDGEEKHILEEDEDLEVISISKITETGVTIEIAKLSEKLEKKTITVKDSEGKEIPVKAIDIEAGETEVTFEFEKAVEKETLKGTWTVEGKQYKFEEEYTFVEKLEMEVQEEGKRAELVFSEDIDKAVMVEIYEKGELVGKGGMTESPNFGTALVNLTKAGKYELVVKDGEVELARIPLTVNEVKEEELVVESVSAISETVNVDGTIEFEINNNGKMITADKLPEGYSAKFLSTENVFVDTDSVDKQGFTSTTGKLAKGKEVAKAEEKFKVQIEIVEDETKEVVAKSDRVEITVENYSEIVTEITELKTTIGEDGKAQVIEDGKIALGDKNLKINVKGTKKGSEEEVSLTNDAEIESSNKSVLRVEDGVITPVRKGNATVTIKVGGQEEKIDFVVGEEREVAEISLDKSELALATGQEQVVKAEIKDQYGLFFAEAPVATNADDKVKVIKDQATGAEDTEAKTIGVYNLTLTAADEAAKGKVKVTAGQVEELIDIEVKKAKEEIATYKLETKDGKNEAVIDLKTNTDKKVEFNLVGLDDQGLQVDNQPKLDGENYKLISDSKNFTVDGAKVTYNENAGKDTEATITVAKINGAFEDVIEGVEIKISVVDSTPKLVGATIKNHEVITKTIEELDIKDLVELEVEAEGEEEVELVFGEFKDSKIVVTEKGQDKEIATIDFLVELVKLEKVDGKEGVIKVTVPEATAKDQEGYINIAVNTEDKNFANKEYKVEVKADEEKVKELAEAKEAVKDAQAAVDNFEAVKNAEDKTLDEVKQEAETNFVATKNAEGKTLDQVKQEVETNFVATKNDEGQTLDEWINVGNTEDDFVATKNDEGKTLDEVKQEAETNFVAVQNDEGQTLDEVKQKAETNFVATKNDEGQTKNELEDELKKAKDKLKKLQGDDK